MFALTSLGIVAFEGIITHADTTITLVPLLLTFVPRRYSNHRSSGTSQRRTRGYLAVVFARALGKKFKVFDGMDSHMHGVKEVSIPNLNPESEPQTRHIECCEVARENRIALADRHFCDSVEGGNNGDGE